MDPIFKKRHGAQKPPEPSPETSPEFTKEDAEIISEGVHEASALNPNKGEKVEDVEEMFQVGERQKGPHEHVH